MVVWCLGEHRNRLWSGGGEGGNINSGLGSVIMMTIRSGRAHHLVMISYYS